MRVVAVEAIRVVAGVASWIARVGSRVCITVVIGVSIVDVATTKSAVIDSTTRTCVCDATTKAFVTAHGGASICARGFDVILIVHVACLSVWVCMGRHCRHYWNVISMLVNNSNRASMLW